MIVFLIILGATIALTSLIVFLVEYHETNDSNAPRIKFESFRTFYELNPKRWRLGDCYVVCKDSNNGPYWGLFDNEYRFYFSFIDSLRYRSWHKHIDKHNTSQANAKITAKMLAAVKRDIANVEQLARSEFNKANDIIQKVERNHND